MLFFSVWKMKSIYYDSILVKRCRQIAAQFRKFETGNQCGKQLYPLSCRYYHVDVVTIRISHVRQRQMTQTTYPPTGLLIANRSVLFAARKPLTPFHRSFDMSHLIQINKCIISYSFRLFIVVCRRWFCALFILYFSFWFHLEMELYAQRNTLKIHISNSIYPFCPQ